MKASGFFTFLGGVALGAVAALLLAPDDGYSTRKKIRRKLRKYGIDLSKEEFNELIEKFRNKYSKKSLNDIVD